MPSKKRKYNARFPAGRIKKIMQTDEEVGKVAQAVPIIISRTLELFVESLLSKAMQVTLSRNAKTLSPPHVKQCILAESRFDFLRDLVKNIPDVSAAEEKEIMSAESSPNSSRFSDMSVPPRKIAREDSNSSSSSDVRIQSVVPPNNLKRCLSTETEVPNKIHKNETITSGTNAVIDLSKKTAEEKKLRTANFYQETLPDDVTHKSVITPNPTYSTPQASTSNYKIPEPTNVLQPVPKDEQKPMFYLDVRPMQPVAPVTPILNIDFTKSLAQPEIKVLSTPDVVSPNRNEAQKVKLQRQNSKPKVESKKIEKAVAKIPLNIDFLNSGNLQIDEDYDT